MKTEYEMTEQDLQTILDCSKSAPMIALQCGTPMSPQEKANRAWAALGARLRQLYLKGMVVRHWTAYGFRYDVTANGVESLKGSA